MTDTHDERRIVTVVAADVVGSTRIVEQLDGEHAKLIIGEALRIAISAVERYGGTVKDLAGDGVLALFGAPVSHEDDAARALLASLAITVLIRDYAEEARRSYGLEGFAMRVGVATGEAVLGMVGGGTRVEYGAVGDAVNTAARLQSAASPGTVLVAASTRSATEKLFRWGAAAAFELKGKEEPVTATVLYGAVEPDVHGTVATPLVGRTAELDAIDRVLSDLSIGRGAVVFLVADAGLGKSRLLSEARARAGQRTNIRWLDAHCASYAEAIPYWVYREVLFDWLGVTSGDPPLRMRLELRHHLADIAGARVDELAPYLASLCGLQLDPDVQAKLRALSPEALQYRTFEVMSSLFEGIAAQRPLVIALDDLHWADPTSVRLSEQLLPLLERFPIVLLIAMRIDRDHPSWALRRTCEEEYPHLFRELRVPPLGQDDERRLVSALTGQAPIGSVDVERLLTYSDGNPFFLEELIRSMTDRSGAVVPPTIGAAIQARVDRLDATARQLLRAAAVLGRSFSLGLLAAVAHESPETVWRVIHELQRLDFVREQRRLPEPEFRFRHALIQEAVYSTLLQVDRVRLHGRAAAALESARAGEQPALLGVLAIHWSHADDPEKAIHYLRLAGDTARNDWALDEAIEHYRALVPLLRRLNHAAEAATTLFKLGLTLHTAMRYEEANTAWQEAFTIWAPEHLMRAHTAELRIASPAIPGPPDVLGNTAWTNIQVAMQVYDRVVEAWPERNAVPSLADTWTVSGDGLRYEFHLRAGLTWHDGTPLTAAHVERAMKRALDPRHPAAGASIYFVIRGAREYYFGDKHDASSVGVHALDDRRLIIELAHPAPYFMSVMNRPDANAHLQPESTMGSGAFRVTASAPGRLTLERVNTERLRRGNVGRVEMVQMDAEAAAEAYLRDEVDMVPLRVGGATTRLPIDHPEASITPLAATVYLVPDCARGCSSQPLRRALAAAIDTQRVRIALPPASTVATGGIVPPALQGHTADIAVGFDPATARRWLRKSGFIGPLRFVCMPVWNALGVVVADSWREHLGIEVVFREDDPDELALDVDVHMYNWLPGYPDPEYYLRLLLHSASLTNRGRWANSSFDELIDKAVVQRESGARLEMFHAADRLAIREECALIPLGYLASITYVKPWVSGWWEFGKSSASFADLIVDDAQRPAV